MYLNNHKHISSCPKCGGWRYLDGNSITCINCALTVEIPTLTIQSGSKFLDIFKGERQNGKQTD